NSKNARAVLALGVGLASEKLSERFVEAASHVVGEGNGFGLAVDLDGLAGGIHDQAAVFAALQVNFEIGENCYVEVTLEIAGQLADDAFAVHVVALRRKNGLRISLNFNRARRRRDFTAGTEMPRSSAVSSVEICSTSRRRKTVRKMGSSLPMASLRMEFIS